MDSQQQLHDPIGESLDLVPLEGEVIENKSQIAYKTNNQIDTDFEYARGNLISVIEKGNEALTGILDVASISQHPRAYEVYGTLLKNMVDANKELLAWRYRCHMQLQRFVLEVSM